jgi:hypothetical protein
MKRSSELLALGLSLSSQLISEADGLVRKLDEDPLPDVEKASLEYAGAASAPARPEPWGSLLERAARSEVIFIGDYGTCQQPKILARKLVERFPQGMLALNMVPCEEQEALQAWMEKRLSASLLAERTSFDDYRPPYAFKAYLGLLEKARSLDMPVFLCDPAAARSLKRKDEDTALILESMLKTFPHRPLIALVGEVRLAPSGLPALLGKLAGRRGPMVLSLDQPSPFLEGVAGGGTGRGVFSYPGKRRFVVVTQSPLARLQSFLTWHAMGETPVPAPQLSRTFAAYARRIARTFDLPWPRERRRIACFEPGDPTFLATLDRRSPLSTEEIAFLAGRIRAGESRCLPGVGLAYIGHIAASHVAEEAAHYARSVIGGTSYCTDGEHAFWGIAVNELAGYLGSKVIVPARMLSIPDRLEAKGSERSEALAHIFGYRVAHKLHDRLPNDPSLNLLVQRLFKQDLVAPGAAKKLYFETVDRVAR